MRSLSVVAAGLVMGVPQALAAPNNKSTIKWGKCKLDWGQETEDGLFAPVECATLKAPLDYSNPGDRRTIDLQLVRVKAKKEPARGSIFWNPGGPGSSGVLDVVTNSQSHYDNLDGEYNFVAVDPRGTGRTIPFNCSSVEPEPSRNFKREETREWDFLPQIDLWPEIKDKKWKELGERAEKCYKARKETGSFIGTAFSARDIMHAVDALGEDGLLRYIGTSYGTVLGQTLAGMFPDRIDRILIDGNVMIDEYVMGLNPSITHDTEKALVGLINDCVDAGPELCSLANYTGADTTADDLLVAIGDLWAELLKTPEIPKSWGLPSEDYYQGGPSLLRRVKSWIFTQLYGASNFGDVVTFLEQMLNGDWKELKENLADATEEESQPGWEWGADALHGIYCGDQAYRAETVDDYYSAWALHTEQNSFSDVGFWDSEAACARWPFKAAETIDMNKFKHVNTRFPVLLVNSRYDPVTPLVSAYEASTRFSGSRVVVHEGYGHGVMGHSSKCTNKAIKEYFINGKMPETGLVCKPDLQVFEFVKQQQEATEE